MRKSRNATRPGWAGVGLTTGVVGAALLVAPQAAFATVGAVTPPVVNPGSIVKLTDAAAGMSNSTVVQISTAASCPSTYVAAGANNTSPWAGTSVSYSANVLTFTLPAGVVAGTNGVAKTYQVCAYGGTTVGTSALQSNATVAVGLLPMLSPMVGPTGGGNPLNITGVTNGAIFTGVATPAAIFTTSACTATYGTTPTGAAMVTKNSDNSASIAVPSTVTTATTAPTVYNVCLYNGAGTTSALISSGTYSANVVVPSQAIGPSGSANGPSITFSSPNPLFAGVSMVGVVFTSNATCTATYTSGNVANTNVIGTGRRMTDNKIAVTVPNLGTNNTTYQACIYSGTSNGVSDLLGSAAYNTMTVQQATSIMPSAGPSLGGNMITVTGTNFPTTPGSIQATLGGSPLQVTPKSATGFSAMVPSHAAAKNATLVVTTDRGTTTLANAYSFINALALDTNTGPNTAANVDVVVNGVGFQNASWNAGGLNGAHFYLVRNTYDPSPNATNDRTSAPVQECTSVLAISDEQAVCGLVLNRRLDAAGTATYAPAATPVRPTTLATTNGSRFVTATGSPFTTMMVGHMIGGVTIPPNTKITRVIDANNAVISNAANATAASDANTIIVPASAMRTVTVGIGASGTATITNTNSVLTSADLGLTAWGPDLAGAAAAGTNTILSTTAFGSNITGGGSAVPAETLVLYTATVNIPVPEGAYNFTYVSNGNVNASATDADYNQSAVSSGSIFTVAPF